MTGRRLVATAITVQACLVPAQLQAATVPLGLPDMPAVHDAHAREKQALGARLFSDKRLSADGTISCASCHPPDRLFMDGNVTGKGIREQRSFRNTPSLLNAAYLNSFFWDGRASTLESQLQGPLTNPREHALANTEAVVDKVREDASYVSAFSTLYASNREALGIRQISDAIASYERTLVSGDSPFDRYYYGGDKTALSASAVRGMNLFMGRANCASCHRIDAHSALFTDLAFHRAPTPLPESLTRRLSELTQEVVAAKQRGDNSLDALTTQDSDVAELGRFVVTLNPKDIGTFRTPSLRDVALTGPYMHNGAMTSLESVIDAELYTRGSSGNLPIVMAQDERQDILEFLNSLNGARQ